MCHSREGSRCDIVLQQISPGLSWMNEKKKPPRVFIIIIQQSLSATHKSLLKKRVKEKKEKRILHLKALLIH